MSLHQKGKTVESMKAFLTKKKKKKKENSQAYWLATNLRG